MSVQGFVNAAGILGLESVLISPKRAIGDFTAQVTIREVHRDDIEITDHPIEQGAVISDHAFIKPAEVVIECGWSNSPSTPSIVSGLVNVVNATLSFAEQVAQGAVQTTAVQEVYEKLLNLQKQRELFDVYTGKRAYTNMLIKSLVVETDADKENVLHVTVTCREVIVVQTEVVNVPANDSHADPQQTSSPVNTGSKSLQTAPNFTTNPQAGP